MKKLLIILIFILAVQVQGLCATLYLRSTGGNWSDPNTWSASSNGAVDGNTPTNTTDVVCDPNSGSAVLTVNTHSSFKTLDMTNFTGTFNMGGGWNINAHGNVTFGAGQTVSGATATNLRFYDSGIIITNGKTVAGSIKIGATGKTLTLGDNLTCSNNFIVRAGTLNTSISNYSINCTGFKALDSGVKTVTLNNSTITCTSLDTSGTNLTFSANTSTINCTGAFDGGGYNLNGASVNLTGTSAVQAISGANTFANLTITGHASSTGGYTINANQTVTGTFTANGNSVTNRCAIKSSDTTVRTITAGVCSLSNIDYYQNIKGAGDGWIGKVPFFNSAFSWNPTIKYSGILR